MALAGSESRLLGPRGPALNPARLPREGEASALPCCFEELPGCFRTKWGPRRQELFLVPPHSSSQGPQEPAKACYMFAAGTGKAHQGNLVPSLAQTFIVWDSVHSDLTLSSPPQQLSLPSQIPSKQAPLADRVLCPTTDICHSVQGQQEMCHAALNSRQF